MIGQSRQRVEDDRHLLGRARFMADLEIPDCLEVAFLRSPVAHGVIRSISLPQHVDPQAIWDGARIAALTVPITAQLLRAEFKAAPMPLLASHKVLYVGEPMLAVTAPSRAQAEDILEDIDVRIDACAPIMDVIKEMATPSAPMHAGLDSNVVMRFGRTIGDAQVFDDPELFRITKKFSMARVMASPLEGRGCACYIDGHTGELVVHVSSQRPHLLRTFLAEHIQGLRESDVRVVVPDVGGGFGSKSNLYPEELIVAAMTLATGRAHRWTEDRYEHLVAANHSRQHDHEVTAHFDSQGRIHAVQAQAVVDSGAYSSKTSTGAIEANMATNVMLGPYDIRHYRFEAISVFSNKSPVGPFRGVGRPAGCFSMERIMDEVAHTLQLDPVEVRRRNLIRADQFPYTTATGLYYDSGDYDTALSMAQAHAQSQWPAEKSDDRYHEGTGYAMYVEQAAHGTVEWHRRGSTLVYGHEAARATLTPDGSLVIDVGTLGHGQGHETSLAQIASQVSGVAFEHVRIRQGDTARTPYGLGSVASRSIVMAGGAVTAACQLLRDKALRIASAVLQQPIEALRVDSTGLHSMQGHRISWREVGRLAVVELHKLPRDIAPGMSVEGVYRPEVETGTFSYGVHVARVRVDTWTGLVTLTNYAVVEDCGTLVNPLIVDGQIRGGVAQGIGQALYEALRYTPEGQPVSVTFGDYTLPSSQEIPTIDILHMCTPSPFSEFGIKGMGEGGAVGPPAAVANAVRQALRGLGVEIDSTPIHPDHLLAQLMSSKKMEWPS